MTTIFVGLSLNQESSAITLRERYFEKRHTILKGISGEIREEFKNRQVLFVTGMASELGTIASDYFGTNAEVAKELGMKVHFFSPKTLVSPQNNAERLRQTIL